MSQYDCVNGNTFNDGSDEEAFTIGKLIEVLTEHKDLNVKLLGTDYSLGELGSWRGSYHVPAISKTRTLKTGGEIVTELWDSLKEIHYGYKGGEYKFYPEEEFYVSDSGYVDEYVVVKAIVENNELVLYTKVQPW